MAASTRSALIGLSDGGRYHVYVVVLKLRSTYSRATKQAG
jgi:hypothetical protein